MHRLDSSFAFWPLVKYVDVCPQHSSLKHHFVIVRPTEPSENGLAKVKNIAAASISTRAVTYGTSCTPVGFHPSDFNAGSKKEAKNLILPFADSGNCNKMLSAASSCRYDSSVSWFIKRIRHKMLWMLSPRR